MRTVIAIGIAASILAVAGQVLAAEPQDSLDALPAWVQTEADVIATFAGDSATTDTALAVDYANLLATTGLNFAASASTSLVEQSQAQLEACFAGPLGTISPDVSDPGPAVCEARASTQQQLDQSSADLGALLAEPLPAL